MSRACVCWYDEFTVRFGFSVALGFTRIHLRAVRFQLDLPRRFFFSSALFLSLFLSLDLSLRLYRFSVRINTYLYFSPRSISSMDHW